MWSVIERARREREAGEIISERKQVCGVVDGRRLAPHMHVICLFTHAGDGNHVTKWSDKSRWQLMREWERSGFLGNIKCSLPWLDTSCIIYSVYTQIKIEHPLQRSLCTQAHSKQFETIGYRSTANTHNRTLIKRANPHKQSMLMPLSSVRSECQ